MSAVHVFFLSLLWFSCAQTQENNNVNKFLVKNCLVKSDVKTALNCVLSKALNYVSSLNRNNKIEIMSTVFLERNSSIPADSNHEFINTTSPLKLLEVLMSKTSDFISDRVLKIQLPSVNSNNVARTFEESRAKMKKMGGLAVNLISTVLPVATVLIGAVALLSIKAVVVGKFAFIISILILIQSFFGYRSYNGGTNFLGNGGPGYSLTPTYGPPNVYGGTNSVGGTWGTSQYPYSK